jgi:hypothetical protein
MSEIEVDERTERRFESCMISGENPADTLNRLMDESVGTARGQKVEAQNVTNIPVRVGETWLSPGESAEFWSENSDLMGAKEMGHVETV